MKNILIIVCVFFTSSVFSNFVESKNLSQAYMCPTKIKVADTESLVPTNNNVQLHITSTLPVGKGEASLLGSQIEFTFNSKPGGKRLTCYYSMSNSPMLLIYSAEAPSETLFHPLDGPWDTKYSPFECHSDTQSCTFTIS